MEIRWLCKILLVTLIVYQSDAENKNLEKIRKPIKNATNPMHTKSNSIPNIRQNAEKEEFIDKASNQPHSRKKRLIWVTDDGRLALPPGTTLAITPTIAMPLVRHPPEGFLSNITISLPVSIDFDKLGLTDEQNPLGDLPPVFARSFGNAAGDILGSYISKYIHHRRKRDAAENRRSNEDSGFFQMKIEPEEKIVEPEMPAEYKHAFHGGERAILYGYVEDFIGTFGFNGKACILRTICEVHNLPMARFGVFGEIMKLFLTASKSPFSDHISEYVRAQEIGEGKIAPGECFPYYKDCPRGLFKVYRKHKYSDETDDDNMDHIENHDMVDQSYNEIKNEIYNKKMLKERILTGVDSM